MLLFLSPFKNVISSVHAGKQFSCIQYFLASVRSSAYTLSCLLLLLLPTHLTVALALCGFWLHHQTTGLSRSWISLHDSQLAPCSASRTVLGQLLLHPTISAVQLGCGGGGSGGGGGGSGKWKLRTCTGAPGPGAAGAWSLDLEEHWRGLCLLQWGLWARSEGERERERSCS